MQLRGIVVSFGVSYYYSRMITHRFVSNPIRIRWTMFPFAIKLVTSFDGIDNFGGKPRTAVISNTNHFNWYTLII